MNLLLACESAGSCDAFQLFEPMRCCFIGVCKAYFFWRPTVIDDVQGSLWFSEDTVRWVIQAPMEHVEIKASHSRPEAIQGNPFLLGRFAPRGRLVSGITVNCSRLILFHESLQGFRSLSKCRGGMKTLQESWSTKYLIFSTKIFASKVFF